MDKNLFDEQEQAEPSEETFTLEVDGKPMELTMEQLLQAAKAGLEQGNRMARRQNIAGQVPDGEVYAQFLEAYPDIKPDEIPAEVWNAANQDGNLLSAYRRYEIEKLRAELEAIRKNQDNRKNAVGSAVTDGEAAETDPIIAALFGRQ